MLHDHVGALIEQRLGGVSFLAGIEPRVRPDDLDLDVGIDGLRTEDRRVDAGDDFRDRERADIDEHAGLRHLGGDDALDVAAFVEPPRIGRHVLVALVAGGVLEMHVGIFLGHLQRRLHVAERGREDQLVAGAHQLFDRTLGIRTFADVLEERRLDLVTEFLDHGLARQFMLVGPAEIANRAEIDKSDFELVGGGSAEHACSGGEHHCRCRNENLSHGFLLTPRGGLTVPMRTRPIARASGIYRSGTNTVPNAAGAVEPPVLAREISTRTMTVARYGNADMNCDGMPRPAPCACNCRIVTAPNRYAPITSRPGRHDENTTSASAIQPRPAVMPGMKNGV